MLASHERWAVMPDPDWKHPNVLAWETPEEARRDRDFANTQLGKSMRVYRVRIEVIEEVAE